MSSREHDTEPERKKRKKLVRYIPEYTHSYTNDSQITSLVTNPNNSVIITGLADGRIKFWKRDEAKGKDVSTLKCIKQFVAHPGHSVSQLLVNRDNSKLATFAKDDKHIKLFDLTTLDMIQGISIDFVPNVSNCNTWFTFDAVDSLLIGDQENDTKYWMIIPEEQEQDQVVDVSNLFRIKRPIRCIIYNHNHECFISCDDKGLIEYWTPKSLSLPEGIDFKVKSQTDLFKLIKMKIIPNKILLNESYFIVQSEQYIHQFNFKSGKIIRTIKEEHIANACLAGNTLLYSTKDKIICYDLQTHDIIAKYGKEKYNLIASFSETETRLLSSEMITSKNPLINSQLKKQQPIILATLSDKLFVFDSTKPIENTFKNSKVTLHTTLGDIKIELFDKLAPKTVENFIKLCNKKYYNNIIFHRVIKHFMIQTGDPNGDGTGGESCWGGHFPDEINNQLNHKNPFMVSMANAGPNTNGSQFFITTEEASFLDNKHTIFGKIISGIDVVKQIENVETDENDKPIEQIAIISTTTIVQ
ncbi:Peptidyl-prolyl cis-trans isomerase CYP71 [Spathaspora sp. JA1]|nr:Peptidyl-prolyl cis-trans isomerase CYP71 [Spathaspora sp. JA1]